MANDKPGYVYILTNPSFREDWVKIGMTKNMEERLRTLDNTSVPLPFKKYATLKTIKYQAAEKLVHHYIERFTDLRIRDNREFFNVRPEDALKIFRDVAELLDDAEIEVFAEEATGMQNVCADSDSMSLNSERPKGQIFNTGYWTAFNEFMQVNPSDLFHTPNATYDHWMNIAIGIGGVQICLLLNKREQKATVQLYMWSDVDKKMFDALLPYKEQAEQRIGQSLCWRRMDGKKASAVELYLNNCGITDSGKWNDIFSWYKEYTERFISFFKPLIKNL